MKRRAFSGLLRPGEPFDWPLFWRGLPWQPVPQWILVGALAAPFSRAFPALSRAACAEPARTMISQSALVVYTMLVPVLVVAPIYLLAGRHRLVKRAHRLIANVTFALILVLSAADALVMANQLREQWPTLSPALRSLRAACWP